MIPATGLHELVVLFCAYIRERQRLHHPAPAPLTQVLRGVGRHVDVHGGQGRVVRQAAGHRVHEGLSHTRGVWFVGGVFVVVVVVVVACCYCCFFLFVCLFVCLFFCFLFFVLFVCFSLRSRCEYFIFEMFNNQTHMAVIVLFSLLPAFFWVSLIAVCLFVCLVLLAGSACFCTCLFGGGGGGGLCCCDQINCFRIVGTVTIY